MTSDIVSIYSTISGLSVTGVKTVRNLPDVKLAVAAADLPCRLLLPSVRGDMGFVMIGTAQKVEWAIRDLCLWAPLSAGKVEEYAEAMTAYIVDYLTELKAIRGVAGQSHITGFAFQMGPQPWGNSDYWAIDATISVEEIL